VVALLNLPTDVIAFISRKFDAADRDAAAAMLAAAVIEDGTCASERLIRCAAVASGGSLASLRAQIERLEVDWRDVIVAGEYEPLDGDLTRVRDLNDPITDEV
jgi:hypothetical protein